jgi:ATP-dependent DNA helicase RecG
MQISDGPPESVRPRNVGLLFFTDEPHRYFPYTQIDVVHFPQGKAGEIREKRFVGPLGKQLRDALPYIESTFVVEHIIKRPDRAEADRFFPFPYAAIEEALANAVYHRGYDVREPIEVQITPTELTITSYPGPDPSVRIDALNGGGVVGRRYRNRRVGEFLKELRLTEGRGTGVPTIFKAMRDNGSPEPRFETDAERAYFTTILPIHPLAFAADSFDAADRPETEAPLVSDAADLLRGLPLGREILRLSLEPQPRAALHELVGTLSARHFARMYLQPLVKAGLLTMTNPSRPNASTQRYQTTAMGKLILDGLGEYS